MVAKDTELVLPIDVKNTLDTVPLYVPISPVDVVTAWRKPETNIYLCLGQYVGTVNSGNKIVGLSYKSLKESEKDVVRKGVNVQNRDAKVIFEVEDLNSTD